MVELVVVILVMALLAAVGVVAFSQVTGHARVAAAKAELTTVAKAAVAELTMREASAFDAVWVTPLYGEVVTETTEGVNAASGVFTPLGPDTPLTAVGQYGLAFKDLAGQVNATQGVGVTFATWVDGTIVSVSASAAGTITDHEGENTAAWASGALNSAVQERTNLATNPSFETANGTVVVRTNLVENPVGPAQAVPNAARLQMKWAGKDGTAPTSWVTGTNDGPAPGIESYARSTWTGIGTAAADIGAEVSMSGSGGYPVTPGMTMAVRMWLRYSIAGTPTTYAHRVGYFDAEGIQIGVREMGASQIADYAPNKWVEFAWTFTPPEGAAFAAVDVAAVFNVADLKVGDTRDATGAMLEVSPVVQPYFDGNTRPVLARADDLVHADGRVTSGPLTGALVKGGVVVDPDFTPAWTGEPNKSTSVLRAPGVAGVANSALASTRWGVTGGLSMRVNGRGTDTYRYAALFGANTTAGNNNVLRPGHTYRIRAVAWLPAPQTGTLNPNGRARQLALYYNTVEGASGGAPVKVLTSVPNEAGEHPVAVTVTVPESAVWAQLLAYNGAHAGNGDIWWDDIIIEDITDGVPADDSYFDGDTPGTARSQYRWNGAPHRSTSVAMAW